MTQHAGHLTPLHISSQLTCFFVAVVFLPLEILDRLINIHGNKPLKCIFHSECSAPLNKSCKLARRLTEVKGPETSQCCMFCIHGRSRQQQQLLVTSLKICSEVVGLVPIVPSVKCRQHSNKWKKKETREKNMNSQVFGGKSQNVKKKICHYRTAYVLDLWITNAPLFTRNKSAGALVPVGCQCQWITSLLRLFHCTAVV